MGHVHACEYMCVQVHMCKCMHVGFCVQVHMCGACGFLCAGTHVQVFTYGDLCAGICVHVYAYEYVHVQVYSCGYLCVHREVHICRYMCVSMCVYRYKCAGICIWALVCAGAYVHMCGYEFASTHMEESKEKARCFASSHLTLFP